MPEFLDLDKQLRSIRGSLNRKNDLILIITPEKQDKTLELSKHWSVDSTPARNEVIMNRTYPVKVEVAKKVQLEEHITKECRKLEEFREYPGVYDDAMREDITKRIDTLNDELKVRQESIDLLKGRLKNQITSFKETIAKVLDKDTSLGEKIRTQIVYQTRNYYCFHTHSYRDGHWGTC